MSGGIVITRDGAIHSVSYRLNNGSYRSLCGKVFTKNLRLNTLASDNSFDGMCSMCKRIYDEMYLDDLNYEPRMAHNGTQYKYNDIIDFHKLDIDGPKAKYEDLTERRWPKLTKYQRKIQSKK